MTDEMKESLNKTIKIIIYGLIIFVVLFILNNLLAKKNITFKTEDGKYSLTTNLEYTGVSPKGYLSKNADIEFITKNKNKFGYLELYSKSTADTRVINSLADYSAWATNRIIYNNKLGDNFEGELVKLLNTNIQVIKYNLKSKDKEYFVRAYYFETDTDYGQIVLTGLKKDEEKTIKEFDNIVSTLEMSN